MRNAWAHWGDETETDHLFYGQSPLDDIHLAFRTCQKKAVPLQGELEKSPFFGSRSGKLEEMVEILSQTLLDAIFTLSDKNVRDNIKEYHGFLLREISTLRLPRESSPLIDLNAPMEERRNWVATGNRLSLLEAVEHHVADPGQKTEILEMLQPAISQRSNAKRATIQLKHTL